MKYLSFLAFVFTALVLNACSESGGEISGTGIGNPTPVSKVLFSFTSDLEETNIQDQENNNFLVQNVFLRFENIILDHDKKTALEGPFATDILGNKTLHSEPNEIPVGSYSSLILSTQYENDSLITPSDDTLTTTWTIKLLDPESQQTFTLALNLKDDVKLSPKSGINILENANVNLRFVFSPNDWFAEVSLKPCLQSFKSSESPIIYETSSFDVCANTIQTIRSSIKKSLKKIRFEEVKME